MAEQANSSISPDENSYGRVQNDGWRLEPGESAFPSHQPPATGYFTVTVMV